MKDKVRKFSVSDFSGLAKAGDLSGKDDLTSQALHKL